MSGCVVGVCWCVLMCVDVCCYVHVWERVGVCWCMLVCVDMVGVCCCVLLCVDVDV